MNGDACYDQVVAALDALTLDGLPSRLTRHTGAVRALPGALDRWYCLAVESHDRVTERMGGDERRITFDLVVSYVHTLDARRRALADGDLIIDAIWAALTGSVMEIEEQGSAIEEDEERLVVHRTFRVAYQHT